jgi:hypothetical protein
MRKRHPLPHANHDFRPEDLPHNRKEVFFDRLKNRYSVFLSLGGILLLFLLPYLAGHLWRDYELSSLYQRFISKEIDEAALTSLVFSTKNSFNLVDLATFSFFALGVSGALRVLEHLAYEEPVFFSLDFWQGVKQNGLLFVLVFFLFSLTDFLIVFVSSLFGGFLYLGEGILYGLALLILLPLADFVLAQGVVYKLSLRGYLQNGLVFYLHHLFPSILAALLGFLPFLAELLPNIPAKEIVAALMVVFYLPLYLLGFFLFANSLMDRHINNKFYPERVHKGFYPKK